MSWLGGWWSKQACEHCFAALGTLICHATCAWGTSVSQKPENNQHPHHQESKSQDHYPHSPSFGRFVTIGSDHLSAWRCHFSRLFSGLSKPSRKFIATQEQAGFSGPPKAPTSGSFLGDKLWSGTQDTGHETVWSSSRTARGTCGKLPMTSHLSSFQKPWQSTLTH